EAGTPDRQTFRLRKAAVSKADAQLLSQDMTAQAALLAAGTLSSVELLRQQLAAIDASQSVINSYIHVDAEGALAAAAESDARRRSGHARPLEGLPVAVKDNIDVAGMVTTAGMETRRHDAAAAFDNPAVAALRAAGAVIVGKLNMHEEIGRASCRERVASTEDQE